MSAAIATAIATVAAAGATTAGAVYAAHKNSDAAENAAKTQSDAAVKTTQIQSDSANRAADIQAQSAKEALAFSRSQSQLSLDQYNQQQQRLQPYRNLGNFALGQPMQGAPPPLSLAALPGSSPLPSNSTATAGAVAPGASSSLSTPVQGGDYQGFFNNLTGGKALDQKGLEALGPQLQAAGIQLGNPNATGIRSKIILPDGTAVRVLNGDTSVASPTGWTVQPGTGPSGGGGASSSMLKPAVMPGQSTLLAPRQITTDSPMANYRSLGGY